MTNINQIKTKTAKFVKEHKKPITIAAISIAALATGGAALLITKKRNTVKEENLEAMIADTDTTNPIGFTPNDD